MLGLHNAAHGESASAGTAPVVDRLACSLAGQSHEVRIVAGTRARRAYGMDRAVEPFRCSYGLNPDYRDALEGRPLRVSGTDENSAVRIVELRTHRFFLATLYVPQFRSSAEAPHPLIVAYLKAARRG